MNVTDRNADAVKDYGTYERVDVLIAFKNAPALPFTYNANGRILDHFEADGKRYLPVPEKDWDCEIEE